MIVDTQVAQHKSLQAKGINRIQEKIVDFFSASFYRFV